MSQISYLGPIASFNFMKSRKMCREKLQKSCPVFVIKYKLGPKCKN